MRITTLPQPTDERTRLRLAFVAALLLSVLTLLVARLWYIQILAGDRYAAAAERNRVQTVSLEAPRGRVLDRDGRVLVDNRQVHVIGVRVDEMGGRRATVLRELAALLGIDARALDDRLAGAPRDPLRPVPVAFDVPERIALFVWEHQSTRFPGVYAELLPRRSYPHGRLGAHVVGYAGEITAEQLDDPLYAGTEPGAQVGLAGVERSHERTLRGTPGRRVLEIDATGDVVRQTGERMPTPGADLRLTIDVEVQRLAEQALAGGIARARVRPDARRTDARRVPAPAGAVVVVDPRTGALRALASHPSFAPEAFVGGIDADSYAALLDPAAHAPLVNRAVQSAYPPGSVFKVVPAAAALRHHVVAPRTTTPCPPVWRWDGAGQPFRNWTSADEGDITLSEALARSCDTVFYELARRMWETEEQRGMRDDELVGTEARRFGFGAVTGIDLPGEHAGVVPGRRWRRLMWEERHDGSCGEAERATEAALRRLLRELCSPAGARWRGGDAVNLSIGQGDMLATPLQVATSFVAIANGGEVRWPYLAAAVQHADGSNLAVAARPTTTLDLDPAALDVIRRGLEGVTTPGGTAADAFAGSAIPVAGKTGTAEAGAQQPFAWFAGYGPAGGARHVVVVMVEQGGSGSGTAAPIARDIFDGLAALERDGGP